MGDKSEATWHGGTCDAFNDALDDSCDAPATKRVADYEFGGDYPVCDRHYARELAHQNAAADRG